MTEPIHIECRRPTSRCDCPTHIRATWKPRKVTATEQVTEARAAQLAHIHRSHTSRPLPPDGIA